MITPLENAPVAFVYLRKSGDLWHWVVRKCPYCGKKHRHGGHSFSDDPYHYLGGRVSHCSGGSYVLAPEPAYEGWRKPKVIDDENLENE